MNHSQSLSINLVSTAALVHPLSDFFAPGTVDVHEGLAPGARPGGFLEAGPMAIYAQCMDRPP
jgi:hypothetical protein